MTKPPIHSILITGASRGIGLGFVKKFLENPEVEILVAGCRNPTAAKVVFHIDF